MKKFKKVRGRRPIIFTVAGALLLLAAMIFSSKPETGSAAPADLSSIVAKYPILNLSSLQTCDLCHTSSPPNLNPYGAAYKAAGRNVAAFAQIENLDSDGDGFTNIQEINALTFPGNPASFPVLPTATNVPPTNTPAPTNTSVPGPTNTPVPTTVNPTATSVVPSNTTSVTIGLSPASVVVGGSSTVSVNLNSVPAGGLASAEFVCSYNAASVEVSNITEAGLFGTDPVTALNGPANGSFIFAIAGSNGRKATTDGAVITFSAKSLQAGQTTIDCQSRVSSGNLTLQTIPSTPASLTATGGDGTLAGQVIANKPVTITLFDASAAVVGSVNANADGTFSLTGAPGSYTAVASAPGYLKAQAAISITSGNTTTLPTISLLAGDIDGNGVIDQFDALTVGINYNGTVPAEADLSNDGVINVLDLEIMAVNYRQSGPMPWQ